MRKFNQISCLLLVAFFIFSSCSSDDDPELDPGPAPELPPVATMEMNFSDFEDAGNLGGRKMTQFHHGGAALTIGVWNLVLAVNLATPVAAFNVAIAQEPQFDRDRQLWVWSFDFANSGKTYTAELTGGLITNGVEWNMTISEEGGAQNVPWYTGQMTPDASSGYWVLQHDGTEQKNYLRIDWEKENDDIASIQYEVIDEASDSFGDYIKYGRTDTGDFNTFYIINRASEERLVEIEWNREVGDGRIRTTEGDIVGDYLCWDNNFQDIDC